MEPKKDRSPDLTSDNAAQLKHNNGPTGFDALRNPRLLTREVLAGLVVALALIPEAISFSIIGAVGAVKLMRFVPRSVTARRSTSSG